MMIKSAFFFIKKAAATPAAKTQVDITEDAVATVDGKVATRTPWRRGRRGDEDAVAAHAADAKRPLAAPADGPSIFTSPHATAHVHQPPEYAPRDPALPDPSPVSRRAVQRELAVGPRGGERRGARAERHARRPSAVERLEAAPPLGLVHGGAVGASV